MKTFYLLLCTGLTFSLNAVAGEVNGKTSPFQIGEGSTSTCYYTAHLVVTSHTFPLMTAYLHIENERNAENERAARSDTWHHANHSVRNENGIYTVTVKSSPRRPRRSYMTDQWVCDETIHAKVVYQE